MRKLVLVLFAFMLTFQIGNCSLLDREVNILNLKENNMYVLDLDVSVKNIQVSNRNIINVMPITSIANEKNQLFIEANKSGVCDVILTTDSNSYQLRLISGPNFQDNRNDLTLIDIPKNIEMK